MAAEKWTVKVPILFYVAPTRYRTLHLKVFSKWMQSTQASVLTDCATEWALKHSSIQYIWQKRIIFRYSVLETSSCIWILTLFLSPSFFQFIYLLGSRMTEWLTRLPLDQKVRGSTLDSNPLSNCHSGSSNSHIQAHEAYFTVCHPVFRMRR